MIFFISLSFPHLFLLYFSDFLSLPKYCCFDFSNFHCIFKLRKSLGEIELLVVLETQGK